MISLQIQIIPRSPIVLVIRGHWSAKWCIEVVLSAFSRLNLPKVEFTFEFVLYLRELSYERVHCSLESCCRCEGAIGLDFEEEVRLERVKNLVAGEQHSRHGEELSKDARFVKIYTQVRLNDIRSQQVCQRVILFHDLYCRGVRDLRVFLDLHTYDGIISDMRRASKLCQLTVSRHRLAQKAPIC